ncbi:MULTISPECIES: type II secretion system F family protein [unclassified Isoptericola]|uniref:type II secretion system F family protein n=1 Tax=unclassified Isoptericola TaxID=2623355 RepID=UPI00364E1034
MTGLLQVGAPAVSAAVVAVVVAVAVLLGAVPWWAAASATRRRARRLPTDRRAAEADGGPRGAPVDVAVLLELLGAALRSGAGVPRALDATGTALDEASGATPDGAGLRAAADALRLGADWDSAWRHATDRLAPVPRALRGAWTDGASPSGALRAAGEELLHARRSAARTAAARLGVRLVLPLGACFLPAFVLIGLVPVLLALGIDLLSG